MFRLYQYQTDAMAPEIRKGEWVIQRRLEKHDLQLPLDIWRNHEGPYKYRDAAEIRLWHWQLTETVANLETEGLINKEIPI